ncbi:MAG: LD-carboxypeptidase [Oscillospiraceae bacterium]|nr:LD-carboxypeptidase [Oscillospiraceae bacterium]
MRNTVKNLGGLIKPNMLARGDTIAVISPSWGCAGALRVRWQYKLGVQRLEALGLNVVAAPNALRGTKYLHDNPQARAEDFLWAFENKTVKAIIANIGGSDSVRLLPFLSAKTVCGNPKIFCGYSDVMTLHLYCRHAGLSTFYGDNLLTTVAEAQGWHEYSRASFKKTFFSDKPIGEIPSSKEWSYEPNNHTNPNYVRSYIPNDGYMLVQGSGRIRGALFGGHGALCEYDENLEIFPRKEDFKDSIFFFEDIPEVMSPDYIADFFDWLGKRGLLQQINGIVIGKMRSKESFKPYAERLREVVSGNYGLTDMPIIYGLNFGHASPICVLPYGAEAELDADKLRFTISESGVVS